jgi:Tol biopolymer transport system component
MVMNADGANQRLLIGGPDWEYLPTWSPDGESIAFTSTRDGSAAIYAADAEGNSITKISGLNLVADVASWSPDGMYIVFNGTR